MRRKKKQFKHEPTIARDAAPGTFIFTAMGVGGYQMRCRVAWHWSDGSVCVRPLQLAGGVEHTTIPGDQECRLCDDYRHPVATDDIF